MTRTSGRLARASSAPAGARRVPSVSAVGCLGGASGGRAAGTAWSAGRPGGLGGPGGARQREPRDRTVVLDGQARVFGRHEGASSHRPSSPVSSGRSRQNRWMAAARELWELDAREQIRDTIAAYHEAGDRYRLEELAA